MNRRQLLIKTALAASLIKAWPLQAGQPVAAHTGTAGRVPPPADPGSRADWLARAAALLPELTEVSYPALAMVAPTADKTQRLGYTMKHVATPEQLKLKSFKKGDSLVLDFGDHYTGYLTFNLGWTGVSCDAPARLRLTFGEVVTDVAESLYPYNGWISASWLPDEVINVDFLPQPVRIERRHAFRYVKIEVISTSDNFQLTFDNIEVQAVSSAGGDKHPLPQYDSALWRDIDIISLRTLHECMQTSFEDGPKRDRRLWVGDLRLQALTNYVSFGNMDLVRRCLFLFAGLQRDDGYITACVYEKPEPRIGEVVLIDYAVLYGSIVLDYLRATGDKSTAQALWPIALLQLQLALKNLDKQGMFVAPAKDYVFIDWNAGEDQAAAMKGLDKQAAMQGVMIYAARQLSALARELGHDQQAAALDITLEHMTQAARTSLYDAGQGVFVSGPQRQVSWASQIWLALAKVLPDAQLATALVRVENMPGAIRPLTPYLYHHRVEALIECGLEQQARRQVEQYWGEMAKTGTNTFWEAFDPDNPLASPYGSKQINSYCHAWSCTPSYFIRRGFAKRHS